jgi:hypothetical protein
VVLRVRRLDFRVECFVDFGRHTGSAGQCSDSRDDGVMAVHHR